MTGTWVDLTDTQIQNVYFEVLKEHRGAPMPWGQVQFGKALLEKFKEVNTIPLFTHPPQRTKVVFPTMLRKMWSGSEVQAWLDENVNKENT